MADFEIFAPDDATMQAALTYLGMKAANSGKSNGAVYAVDYYGTKYVESTGLSGEAILTPLAGRYALMRYMGDPANLPTGFGSGQFKDVSMVPLTPPYFHQFA